LESQAVDDGSQIQVIEASPRDGFNFPYILRWRSPFRADSPRFLLVEPNNSGTPSDDFCFHFGSARVLSTNAIGASVSKVLNIPLLVPVFPRPAKEWYIYPQMLTRRTMEVRNGPLRRIDQQLLKMIEDARRRFREMGMPIEEKILLTGFSTSGAFVNRFTALHPDAVQAVAAGGVNGMLFLPFEYIQSTITPFPLGLGDFQELSGEAFKEASWKAVPQFIYMGACDDNDAVKSEDAYSRKERLIVDSLLGEKMLPDRWERCQGIYRDAGANVRFKTYPGIEHTTDDYGIHDDIIAFFNQAIHQGH
jgi:hypothetical protein